MYSARTITLYFIWKAYSDKKELTILKLLNILFLSFGHYLAAKDKVLFNNDIYACKYGPVVIEVYDEFKKFGNSPLQQLLTNDESSYIFSIKDTLNIIDEDNKIFLDLVWDAYKSFPIYKLLELCTKPGSPWEQTNNVLNFDKKVIEEKLIKDYFLRLVSKTNI